MVFAHASPHVKTTRRLWFTGWKHNKSMVHKIVTPWTFKQPLLETADCRSLCLEIGHHFPSVNGWLMRKIDLVFYSNDSKAPTEATWPDTNSTHTKSSPFASAIVSGKQQNHQESHRNENFPSPPHHHPGCLNSWQALRQLDLESSVFSHPKLQISRCSPTWRREQTTTPGIRSWRWKGLFL